MRGYRPNSPSETIVPASTTGLHPAVFTPKYEIVQMLPTFVASTSSRHIVPVMIAMAVVVISQIAHDSPYVSSSLALSDLLAAC